MHTGPHGTAVEMNNESRRGRRTALRYGRFIKWLVSGTLVIVFVSYVVLPFGLSWYLPQLVAKHGIRLSLKQVRIEPFESRLRLSGVRIATGGDTATEWSSVEAQFDLAALLAGRLVVDGLRMSDANVQAGAFGSDLTTVPDALPKEVELGELVIESVELATLSKLLGSPVTVDRLRIASLAALLRPEGSAIEADASIGEGRSRLTGRINSDASGWILDVELDSQGVTLEGVTSFPASGGSWRGTIDGSGPVRLVYSPINGAFSATTGGRWAIEGPEVGNADAVITAARADWDGTAFMVFSEGAVELFSVNGVLRLRGLDGKDADALQVAGAEVTLQIAASNSPIARLSIDASSPAVQFSASGGPVDVLAAEATHVASSIAVTFPDGVAIVINRLKSSDLTAELPAGRWVGVDRIEFERAVVEPDVDIATIDTVTAAGVEWRGFDEPQSSGMATRLTVRGIERLVEGGIRIALASADRVDGEDEDPVLRLHELVLDSTWISPAGAIDIDAIRVRNARLEDDSGTVVLERLSLTGVQRDEHGSTSVRTGSALVVDHSLAGEQSTIGAGFELSGATVVGRAWKADRIRFGQVDVTTHDASYALHGLVLTDAAGGDGGAGARLARIASIEQGLAGSRMVLENVAAESIDWHGGVGRADAIEAAALTLDIVGQRRWQSSGLRLTGVETAATGGASAAAASIETLVMDAADESSAGGQRIELGGLTFDGKSTVQASSAVTGPMQFRASDGFGVTVDGLSVEALEWSSETLAAARGAAPLMSVVSTPVQATFNTVEFASASFGSDGARQLEELRVESGRGVWESARSTEWLAEGLELAGYRAGVSGETMLDLVEARAVEVHDEADAARLRAVRLSARGLRNDPVRGTMLALARIEDASMAGPGERTSTSAGALEVSRLLFSDSLLEIGSLALSRVEIALELTENGKWELPPLPIGTVDGRASFRLRMEEAGTADSDSVIRFVDRTTEPDFVDSIDITSAALQGFDSGAIGVPVEFTVEARADTFESLRADGALIPTLTGTDLDLEARIRSLSLPGISPYTRLHLGQDIAAGHADLTLELAVRSSDLDGVARFSSNAIGLAEQVSPASSTVLDSALAQIVERHGRIELSAPLRTKVDDPEFDLDGLLTRALAATAIETAEALPKAE